MKQISFEWNGTASQARAYVESVKATTEFRRKQNERAEAMKRYAERCKATSEERAEYWKNYFREAI